MKLLILKTNFEGMSIQRNGEMETHIVDPALLGGEMMGGFPEPDLVIVSKNLDTEQQRAALNFAYKLTNYKDGNLSKVVMI